MILDNINDFINLYQDKYNGKKVCELDFNDKCLYAELLEFYLDNYDTTKLYLMIKDIYNYKLKKNKTDLTSAYSYVVNVFDSDKTKYIAKNLTKIGELYLFGIVLSQNYDKAYKWFILDEGRKSPNTLYYLGYMYYYGLSVRQDYKKAFNYLSVCCKHLYHSAYYLTGCCYYYGYGVEQDYKQAVNFFLDTINSSSYDKEKAIYHLGLCYENGYSVDKNFYKAIRFYFNAAKSGYNKAILRLDELGFSINTEITIINCNEYKIVNSIKSEGENVLIDEVTHVGYNCKMLKEATLFGDYHHFKTIEEKAQYELIPEKIFISENIKKIIINKNVLISEQTLDFLKGVIIEFINE